MAKVAYSKLGAKVNTDIKTITVEDKVIEVRQYLTVAEKLALIGRVIELAHDVNNNFSNPLKTEVYLSIEIISEYTNITFSEKQKEDPAKLYDTLYCSGWLNTIFEAIPEEEIKVLRRTLRATQNAFYAYRTSVLGLLDNISTDYSDLNFDISELQEKLSNGENIELVKNIISKLG